MKKGDSFPLNNILKNNSEKAARMNKLIKKIAKRNKEKLTQMGFYFPAKIDKEDE
jgi:hypothetical protein